VRHSAPDRSAARMIWQRVLAGAVSNTVGKVMSAGIWFLLTPFVLSALGPSAYGLWLLVGAFTTYGALLDLGIGGAVVKYVAEHVAREEWDEARSLIASAQWLYLGVAATVVTGSLLALPVFPSLVRIAPEDRSTVMWLLALTGVQVGITIALTPARSVLQGLQRYDLCNALSVCGVLLGAAGTVAVLLAGQGVVAMVAVNIPVTIAAGIAGRWLTTRVAPPLDFRWRGANRAMVRKITAFSASLFAMQCGGHLQTKTDEFVVALFRPVSAVTPYVLSRKLGEVAQLAAVQFLNVLMPLASELHARQDRQQLRQLYLVAGRLTLGIAMPAAIVLVLLGGPILARWVGDAYGAYAPLVAVLAISSLVGVSQWPAGAVLQGMARHGVLAITSLTAGAVNIAISVLLLPTFGLMGVAIGTLLPTVVGSLCVIMPVANRILNVSVPTMLREIWVPGVLPGVPAAGVLWALRHQFGSASAGTLIGAAAASIAVYTAAYLSMPASQAERQLARTVITGGTRRFRRSRVSSLRSSASPP
jgi:O-antigen/teichoic acid export membrane protein